MTARELHIRQRCEVGGRNKYSKESIDHTKECPMCGITEANRKGVHLHGCHVGLNYKEMMDTTCDWYLNTHDLDKGSDKQHIASILKMFQNYHDKAVQNGKLAIQTACARCNPRLETCTPEKVELFKYQGKEAWLQHINGGGTKQRTLPYVMDDSDSTTDGLDFEACGEARPVELDFEPAERPPCRPSRICRRPNLFKADFTNKTYTTRRCPTSSPPDGVTLEVKAFQVSKKKVYKKRKRRDPARPKRAMTPFLYYACEQRKVLRENSVKMTLPAQSRHISRLWKLVTDKAKYIAQSELDKQRFRDQMSRYEPPYKIKRPRSSYAFFMRDSLIRGRQKIAFTSSFFAPRELMSSIAAAWKSISDEERDIYDQMATEDKVRYEVEKKKDQEDILQKKRSVQPRDKN